MVIISEKILYTYVGAIELGAKWLVLAVTIHVI